MNDDDMGVTVEHDQRTKNRKQKKGKMMPYGLMM